VLLMDLEVTGIDQVEQLEDFWRLWFPRRALVLTTEAIAEDAQLRLEDDETAPDGSRWEEWSDNPPGRGYASTRGPDHKLLFSSGDLANSITAAVQSSRYVVGSEVPYALVHQFGSKDGRIPAREYVGVSDELELALDNILATDMDAGWEAVRI
jgi:phage virion morphogenesis protein